MSDVAADMLKRVGMNVDYQATDWGMVVQRRALTKPPAEGGWNLFCTGFSGLDFFTPASHLPLRGNGKGAWFGWPDDAEDRGAAQRLVQRSGPGGAEEDRRRDPDCRRSRTCRTIRSGWRNCRRRSARTSPACRRAFRSSGTCAAPDTAGRPMARDARWASGQVTAQRHGPDAVIVIFGAAVRPGGRPSTTLRWRVEAAAAFGHALRRAAVRADRRRRPVRAVRSVGDGEAAGRRRGVPPERILLEETGTDTLSSARAVARLPRARRIAAPVFAASSIYHALRCVLLLWLCGMTARSASPRFVPAGSRSRTGGGRRPSTAAASPYEPLSFVVAQARTWPADCARLPAAADKTQQRWSGSAEE